MSALEQYLSYRPHSQSRWSGLHAQTAHCFPPLGRWIERKMWPSSLRHMRTIAPGYHYALTNQGTWTLSKGSELVAESLPLGALFKHGGKPVTIFATGPSCRNCDWEHLRQGERFIIAVNGATTVLKDHQIRPDLHLVVDRQFAASGTSHFLNSVDVPLITTHRAASILAANIPRIYNTKSFAIVERVNSWYGLPRLKLEDLQSLNGQSGSPFHFPVVPDSKSSVGWSDRPELGIFSGFTVVSTALQIAVGQGAKDIEIIGMDLSNQGRAYDEGKNPRPSGLVADYEKYILPTFEVMHEALKNSGIKIRNLSPVCPLPSRLFFP